MGLLYPFPVSQDETDFVRMESHPSGGIREVRLKTYGLPYLFWGYAISSMTVLLFLWLAVREPMEKLAAMGGTDAWLVLALEIFIYSLPIVVLGFFFFEKNLIVTKNSITVVQKIFGIRVTRHQYTLTSPAFEVSHHIDAPNVARMKGGPEAVGFQNKGYFTLWANTTEKGQVLIDRHSRKADLDALVALLNLAV